MKILKKSLSFALFICLLWTAGLQEAFAQQSKAGNYWNTLAKVSYKVEEDEFGELYVPEFGAEVQALEGKEITLQGFIIPFEGMFKPKHLILSSLPIDACFFCGTGGPESVAEVYLQEEIKYTARPVKIRGRLKINADDINELMYVLENATFAGYADDK
jgi:hypothetical protein